MSESSVATPASRIKQRYVITNHGSDRWKVWGPEGNELFTDREFRSPQAAESELEALLASRGTRYTKVYSSAENYSSIIFKFIQTEMVLKLTISPELDADLDNMAEEIGTTKGDVVLKGIALLKIAMDAKREGKRIAILDDQDDSEQDITGF